MAKIKVALNNSGGELSSEIVNDETEALDAAILLINDASELHVGDTITVTEVE